VLHLGPICPGIACTGVGTLPGVKVKTFRRVLFAVGVAGLVGALAKLRGKGGVPPTSGGWRELEAPGFR